MSTQQLVKLAKEGVIPVSEVLEKNYGLIKKLVRKYARNNEEFDELFQIACLEFLEKFWYYNENYNCKFSTFIWTCIRNKLSKYIRDNNYEQRIVISIEEVFNLRNNFNEEKIIESIALQQALKNTKLTKKEKLVLKYRLQGLKLHEIGKIMGCSGENVRVIFNRAVRKIKRNFFSQSPAIAS